MSIRIEADTLAELVALARQLSAHPVSELQTMGLELSAHRHRSPSDGKQSGPTVSPADNPAEGADRASEVFGQTDTLPPASSVFGQSGNVQPGVLSTAGADTSTTAQGVQTGTSTTTIVPPPPAPPAAPPASGAVPPPPPPAAGGSDLILDRDGLPWNGQIHASTKTQNADGRWKAKRGVDAAVIAQVTAQMRQVMAGTAPPVGNAPPPPPVSTAMDAATSIQTPTSDPAIAPPPPPPPGNLAITWPILCQRITADLTAGTLTQEALKVVLTAQGVPAFPLLATFPDKVPLVAAALGYA